MNAVLDILTRVLTFIFSAPLIPDFILKLIPGVGKAYESIIDFVKGKRTLLTSVLMIVSGLLDYFLNGGLAINLCDTFGIACEDGQFVGIVQIIAGYIMGFLRIITDTKAGAPTK